jgi:hypothetical protein
MIDSGAMPSNKKKAAHSEQNYSVGDRVKVNLHTGRIDPDSSQDVLPNLPSSSLGYSGTIRWRSINNSFPLVSERAALPAGCSAG